MYILRKIYLKQNWDNSLKNNFYYKNKKSFFLAIEVHIFLIYKKIIHIANNFQFPSIFHADKL